jgi:hypothetical protein
VITCLYTYLNYKIGAIMSMVCEDEVHSQIDKIRVA